MAVHIDPPLALLEGHTLSAAGLGKKRDEREPIATQSLAEP